MDLRDKKQFKHITGMFIIVTVFLIWLQMMLSCDIVYHKVTFVVSCILFALYMVMGFGKIKDIWTERTGEERRLIIAIIAYMAIDIVGIFYSPVPLFGAYKYTTILPMVFMCIMIISMSSDCRWHDYVFLSIGLASLCISIYCYGAYFFMDRSGLLYHKRISLIKDYNVFSTCILMGMLMLLYYAGRIGEGKGEVYIISLLVFIINMPVVILSGSKRGFLLAIFILIGYIYIKRPWRDGKKGVVFLCALLILVPLFTRSVSLALQKTYSEDYNDSLKTSVDIPKEVNIKSNYKTIYNGTALGKRPAIWNIAIKEISSFNISSLLTGNGTGYDCYIYNQKYTEEMDRLYGNGKAAQLGSMSPHNAFLSDMLNGGIIKLCVSIYIWYCVFLNLYIMYKKGLQPKGFIYAIGAVWAIIFINSMISGSYGYIYTKPFWIFITLLFTNT